MFAIRSSSTNAISRRSLILSSFIISHHHHQIALRSSINDDGVSYCSSPTTISRSDDSLNDDDNFVTGTVKFYDRPKAHGKIIVDNPADEVDGASEVFVSRDSIIIDSITTPHSSNDDGVGHTYKYQRPYLYKDERVKFRVEYDRYNNAMARNVTFENGTGIPLFRKHYGSDGETSLLHYACSVGHLETVKSLIENENNDDDGGIINAKNNRGWTPFYCAHLNNHLEIMKFLVENGAQVDETAVHLLLPGYTHQLHEACLENNLEMVRFLIQVGADVNSASSSEGWASLLYALYWGHLEIGKLLIEHGANVNHHVNKHYRTSLSSPGSDGDTVLHVISAKGDLEGAKLLIEHGAKVNATNRYGETPLHVARSLEVVQLLLDNGADVNAIDKGGSTALNQAANEWNSLEVLKLLIENGAKVNTRANKWIYDKLNGETPLHRVAATTKSRNDGRVLEKAKLLIENGADVNAQAADGQTPLQLARSNDHLEVVKFLIEHGAENDDVDESS